MRRLWPRTLAGQLVLVLLGALFVAQLASFLIFADERRLALVAYGREQVLGRTVTLVRLLGETPAELHGRIVRAASGGGLLFRLDRAPAVDPVVPEHADNPIVRRFEQALGDTPVRAVLVDMQGRWRPLARRLHDHLHEERDAPDDAENERERDHGRAKRGARQRQLSIAISLDLGDGRWLNAHTGPIVPPIGWALPSLVALLAAAALVSLAAVLTVRRLTRPLSQLAEAADAFGRGLDGPVLEERGPLEIRRSVRAFNLMRDRLKRFVSDRTRMLAAIGHDLRTPLTSLRLRAEFVEDDETRARLIETLDEMQRMVEAALAFLREEAADEPAREVDLAALVESVIEDFADLGGDVRLVGTSPIRLRCRPDSLRRALRNLIENALRYGRSARVLLEREADEIRVVVRDRGPGIPPELVERVFEPFVRVEASRSRETGGIGLGLAIARTVARAHGGDVTLRNRPEGGLEAVLTLPA